MQFGYSGVTTFLPKPSLHSLAAKGDSDCIELLLSPTAATTALHYWTAVAQVVVGADVPEMRAIRGTTQWRARSSSVSPADRSKHERHSEEELLLRWHTAPSWCERGPRSGDGA